MVTALSISFTRAQVALDTRRIIYRQWLRHVEGQDLDNLKAPELYFFIKHKLGVGLTAERETELVKLALASRENVGPLALGMAEKAGLFDNLPPEFSKNAAVRWGQMAFREWLTTFGASPSILREVLHLQFVEGPLRTSLSTETKDAVTIALELGMSPKQAAAATGLGLAEVFLVVDQATKAP